MNRRQFIHLAQALGLSTWCGEMAFAHSRDHHKIRVRKSLNHGGAMADARKFNAGIGKLKANPVATDYKSWTYWANVHGVPPPVPAEMAKVWGQCAHRTPHFLTWHRAYMFFMEALIREVTQDDSFAIPYWDWFDDPAMPAQFTDGTLPHLLHSPRAYNPRQLLRAPFLANDFTEFYKLFEPNPHGAAHLMVGGDMANEQISGGDPIFWAHHVNVDRLWDAWLAMDPTRANSTEKEWLDQQFVFDTAGKKVIRVSDMLDTAKLGYCYESLQLPDLHDEIPPQPQVILPVTPAAKTTGLVQPDTAAKTSLALTGASVSVALPILNSEREKVANIMRDPQQRDHDLTLTLSDFHVTERGLKRGYSYRIYANLPAKARSGEQHRDMYLGEINSFLLGRQADHASPVVYSLNAIIGRQMRRALWSTNEVRFSFVSADTNEKEVLLEVGSVELAVSSPGAATASTDHHHHAAH